MRAVGLLYDHFAGDVLAVALRLTRDRALAEDVVQETFLGVWRNAGQYRASVGTPRTWILTIARYRAIDLLRRRSRNPADELVPDAPNLPSVPDIWGDVVTRLDRDLIASAFTKLSAPQRRAIELAYFRGLTHREIAAATATPLGTVKSRVRLGLLALRQHLLAAETVPLRPVSATQKTMQDRPRLSTAA
ncbi:MAG: hypothetical protein QOH61_1049 [Chloroflexota bacterium]|nr:hypothetical protein [Chloroflexota bacterium]